MIDDCFFRDGRCFGWEMFDFVEDTGMGQARFVFSYVPKIEDRNGTCVRFDGVSICEERDGRIAEN